MKREEALIHRLYQEGLEALRHLLKENEELRKGICEHVAQNIISSDCELCELAVAKKGYPIWVKKAKDLEKEVERVSWQLDQAIKRAVEHCKENANLKSTLETPEKWMQWCDIKVLEQNEELRKQVSNYKFFTQFTPEECRYLEGNQKRLEQELASLDASLTSMTEHHEAEMKDKDEKIEKLKEYKTTLEAWMSAFGTSQLTHTLDKMEALKKKLDKVTVEKLTELIQDVVKDREYELGCNTTAKDLSQAIVDEIHGGKK